MESIVVVRALVGVGGFILAAMGGLHAVLALADDFAPRFFTPVDDSVRERMADTQVAFSAHLNMWHSWLGFNVSHGLGAFSFGTMCVLLALFEPAAVTGRGPLLLFGAVVSLLYLALSVRFWFRGSTTGIAVASACLVGAVLAS